MDPYGSGYDPVGSAMTRLGFDPTQQQGGVDFNAMPSPGLSRPLGGDPTKGLGGIAGMRPGLDLFMDVAMPQYAAEQDKASAALAAQQQGAASNASAGWNNAGVTTAGGAWANLDAANGYIADAATKFGVPANLIKAMIMNESSGDWARDGSRVVGLRGDQLLPYVGIFGQTAQSWGYDFNALVGNQALQIQAMADGLKRLYDQTGSWDGVVTTYFSGHPVPTGWTDENGMSDQAYLDKTKQNIAYLDSLGSQQPGAGLVGGGWGGDTSGSVGAQAALTSMFGPQASVPGWGEFNVPSSNGLYGYGTAYGMNGSNHTGLDVPLDFGSQMRAPLGGTVLCAGTGVGTDEGGGSCSAFNNTLGGSGQGNGRIEIQLDNGAVLIFGHASSATVSPGQRVNPGALLGYSGGMNSAHVHLEARVPLGGGAWKIVDPRSVLGAAAGSWLGGSTSGGGTAPSQSQSQMSMGQVISNLLSGKPVAGYGS